MAPVPFRHPVRYTPLIIAASHVSLVIYLTYAVGASLYTSYKLLGPAQDTRSRSARRKKLVPIFLGLAVLGFLAATYYASTSLVLSYKTWAWEHGLDLHHRALDADGYISDTKNSTRLYVAQWLSDTPIYQDALEIVAEKARRYWWGQQLDLATLMFSLMLTLEGRRRKIPMLTAFLALAHLVSLSYAQNLFFLALLLTPVPLPSGDEDLELPVLPLPMTTWIRIRNRILPPKPKGWVPHVPLLAFPVTMHFISMLLLPYTPHTPLFFRLAIAARLSTFLVLLWPETMPASWGTTKKQPRQWTLRFLKNMAFVMAIFQAKAFLIALYSNAPDSHYHRHSALLPWDVEERSRWEQTTNALGKVLGSTLDHPFVTAAGCDVLISILSLGAWATIRGSVVKRTTHIFTFFFSPKEYTAQVDGMEPKITPVNESVNKVESSIGGDDEGYQEQEGSRRTLRRSGRATRSRLGSVASSSGASEDVVDGTRRRRGRPRKAKQHHVVDDLDEEHSTTAKQEAKDDQAYIPTPSEAQSALEGEEVPAQDFDWDATALTWGLAALGGLQGACLAVYGGECISY